MLLKKLNLTNFRNYDELDLEFDQRPTVFIGDNAQGKSNVLEAVYFLSTTKSVRVDTDGELIKNGEWFSRVQGVGLHVDKAGEQGEDELEIVMQVADSRFSKRVKINGVPRRVVDFLGHLPSVFFLPSDIEMVTGSPALRRWHLDLSLAQIDSEYKKALTFYEQYLTARNKVLKRIKEGLGRVDELTYWTDELVKAGQIISSKRGQFFEFINKLQTPLGNFQFVYKPSEISAEKLKATNGREIAATKTLIGPHRDDFGFILSGKNLARSGSRGEQRTATLAFKLAQLEFMAAKLGRRPVLLLDDVFSELDESHRSLVGEVALKQQTIISTIEMSEIPNNLLDKARILQVENGKIT